MAVSIVIDITQNSQSVANNTSNITVKVNAKWTGGSYNLLEKSGSVTINGNKYTFTSPFNTSKTSSGSCNLYTKTLNIAHNSDGTKKLTVTASYTSGVSSGTVAASAVKTLTTIPRKSTLTVANGTLGTAQTLEVTRKADSFVHTIAYTCGTASSTICTNSSSTKISFTPPITLASQNTTGTSVTIKFTITTYTSVGGTNLGSNSYSKTYAIPTSVIPTCTISVTDPTGCFGALGTYVQGISKFKVTVTGTPQYGSSISSYSSTANGSTYTSSSFTTGVLKTAGSLKVNSTVTDKRSRKGSNSVTLSVLSYARPKLSNLKAVRCNSDGTPNASGDEILVTFDSNITSLNGMNKVSYTLACKEANGATYSETLTDYADNYNVLGGTAQIRGAATQTCDIKLTVKDTITDSIAYETVLGTTVGTSKKFMSWRAKGTGIAFGKIAEEEDAAEFGFVMRSTHGELVSSPLELPEGTDLDTVTTEGYYIIGTTATSKTIVNKPLWYKDASSTASIYVTRSGSGAQIIQQYYPCVKTEQFVIQRIYYENAWGDWMITGGCTSWMTLDLVTDRFEVYSGGVSPKYRVNGNVVNVTGAVKPLSEVTSNTTGEEFASGIKSQYRPNATLTFICQGSGINRWLLTINSSGMLYVSRYGTNDYVNIPAGAWLTFNVSYSI